MPKAKPISLHPLSFEEAIDILLKAPAKPKKKLATSKQKKRNHLSIENNRCIH